MTVSAPMSKSALWLVLAVASAGSMLYYVIEIWGAGQPPSFSDFYAPWWGAHELLLHRRNPYSPAVAREIQSVIYGAPVNPTADDPSGIAGGFAYPPHAALFLWPLVHISFASAQKAFVGGALLGTLLSLALWLRLLPFRPPPLQWLTIALFVLGSFPVLQGLKLQNLSLIAAAFLTVTVFLLSADHLTLAGIFLAASTFKPQFTIVLIPWLALWTFSDWRRRRSLAWSFLLAMLGFVVVSEWLVPGSISSFLRVFFAYRHYTYGHSLLDVWFSSTFGPIACAMLLLPVLALCWRERFQPADSPRFFLVISLLAAATLVVIPTLAPHAQLLLLPGFLLLLRDRALFLSSAAFARLSLAAAWTLLAWPWIAAIGLLAATLWYPPVRLVALWEIPLYTSPLLPLAIVFAVAGRLLSQARPVQ